MPNIAPLSIRSLVTTVDTASSHAKPSDCGVSSGIVERTRGPRYHAVQAHMYLDNISHDPSFSPSTNAVDIDLTPLLSVPSSMAWLSVST